MYSTWKPSGQVLLVDSPLLSYIDVWHTNFLLPRFTVGEARDLGWRYTCSDELAPLRDESAKHVSQRLQELVHVPVEPKALVQEAPVPSEIPVESEAPVQEAEQVAIELVNSSETESDRDEDMVTRKTMTINCFVPSARQTKQQQPSQGRGQVPPTPPLPPPPSS